LVFCTMFQTRFGYYYINREIICCPYVGLPVLIVCAQLRHYINGDVSDKLDVDFYVFSGHSKLCGPIRAELLYGKEGG